MDEVLQAGSLAGGYRIERLLGSGGMGAVYAAVDPMIGKRAAVKVVHARTLALVPGTETFLREARVVNRIGHPNIVDVFGFDAMPDGRPVLIMELLQGETLRSLIHRVGRLPVADAVRLVLPVLRGLGAAHREGVVHRDLKPENVFLVRTIDSRVVVKLLDFGIAGLMRSESDGPAVTSSGIPVGTPAYMSPEQCRGDRVDGRTDLYAVGLLLFEMIAGRGPFPGGTPAEYLGQQLYAQPARLRDLAAVDAALDELMAAVLSKDPGQRPSTADELEARLTELVPASAETAGGTALSVALTEPDPADRIVTEPASTSPSVPLLSTPPFLPTPDMDRLGGVGGGPMEENRLCTVLFADVSGFTALSEQLAPEEVKDVIDRCFRELSATIERHGGRVDKYIGDCVMAVFGVPRSRDDDPVRAVRAAMEMERAVRALPVGQPRAGDPALTLELRIGVNTGQVFAGMVGGAQRREFTVMGDAVNVAARLQSAAPPGEVVVGTATLRHLHDDFICEELAPLHAKGKSEPIGWARVVEARTAPRGADKHYFYGRPTRFVGRHLERTRFWVALERVREQGTSRMLLVIGAPGSGKTRLRRELRALVEGWDDGTLVLQGQPSHGPARTPYDLFASALRQRFSIGAADSPEVVAQRLAEGLAEFEDDTDDEPTASGGPPPDDPSHPLFVDDVPVSSNLTELSTILGAPQLVPGGGEGEPSGGLRDRIASAMLSLLTRASSRGPVVLLCDSLEHADEASLDLLDRILETLRDRPLLLVGFARPELLERRPAWTSVSDRSELLELPALGADEQESVARDLLSRARDIPPSLVADLVERSDGNPLVLKETIRTLVETGGIHRGRDDVWTVRTTDLTDVKLPSTVYGIVQSRLDRLTPAERLVLMRAAVTGRSFWLGPLIDIAGGSWNAREEVEATLERLARRDLVRVRQNSSFSDQSEYVFTDGVTREVAYEALSRRQRRAHHLAVARWMAARPDAFVRENPAVLALHYERGGARREALRYYVSAGRQASELGRHEEALVHYRRAEDLLEASKVPPTAEAGAEPPSLEDIRVAGWQDRVRLRIHLGDTLRRLGHLTEAEETYQRAMPEILREERRGESPLEADRVAYYDGLIELRLGMVEKLRGNFAEAETCYEAALDRVGPAGEPVLRTFLHAEIAWARCRERDYHHAKEICLRGLRVSREIPEGNAEGAHAVSRLLQTMGVLFYEQRQLVRAERFYLKALRVSEEHGDFRQAAIAYNNLGASYYVGGDVRRAAGLFLRALELKQRMGDLYDIAVGHNNVAETQLELGNVEAALHHARRAVELADRLHATDLQPDAHKNLAAALLRRADIAAALGAAERAFDLAQTPGGKAYLGTVGVVYVRCAVAAASAEETGLDADAIERAVARASRHVVRTLEENGFTQEALECRDLLAPSDPGGR